MLVSSAICMGQSQSPGSTRRCFDQRCLGRLVGDPAPDQRVEIDIELPRLRVHPGRACDDLDEHRVEALAPLPGDPPQGAIDRAGDPPDRVLLDAIASHAYMMALQCKHVNPGAGSARRLIAARLPRGRNSPAETDAGERERDANRGLREERLAEERPGRERRDHRLDQGEEPEPRGPEEAEQVVEPTVAEQGREEPERGERDPVPQIEAVERGLGRERRDQHREPDGAVDGRGVAPEASASRARAASDEGVGDPGERAGERDPIPCERVAAGVLRGHHQRDPDEREREAEPLPPRDRLAEERSREQRGPEHASVDISTEAVASEVVCTASTQAIQCQARQPPAVAAKEREALASRGFTPLGGRPSRSSLIDGRK